MAFKQIPVAAGKVTGTHTDFPVLIRPSLITGLGSITLAEAQSARFYSDAAKTTELAREIVSADEIHVKVSSFSSASIIYMDYDGVRSDYATTATYGARAVWSNHDIVLHFETLGFNSVDDTTTSPSGTVTSVTSSDNGKGASQADGTGNGFNFGASYPLNSTTMTLTQRFKTSASFQQGNGGMALMNYVKPGSPYPGFSTIMKMSTVVADRGQLYTRFKNTSNTTYSPTSSTSYNDGQWHTAHSVYVGGTVYIYVDGVEQASLSASGTPGSGHRLTLGVQWNVSTADVWDGEYDECRATASIGANANWCLAEHNMLDDNGAFWGTATDAGGGGGYTFTYPVKPFAGL